MTELNWWMNLPDEIMRAIFEFLPMAEIIFSLSSTCHCFRKIAFPIISERFDQQLNYTNDEIGDDGSLQEYYQLFNCKYGRKFIRKAVREYVYEFACKLVKVDEKLYEINEQDVIPSLEGGIRYLKRIDFSVSLNEIQELKDGMEFICKLFNNFRDLKELEKIKKKDEEEEVKKKDSNSLFSGLSNLISSIFGNSKDTETPSIYSNADKYKCLLSGGNSVGKTSFVNCVFKNRPCYNHRESIIGVCLIKLLYQWNDTEILLDIWDNETTTAFPPISPMYFRRASIIYCLFDVNDFNNTFQKVEFQMKDVLKMKKPNCEMILIANKTDLLVEGMNSTHRKKAHSYAFNEMNGSLYFEMSTMDIRSAHCIILYSALMAHFTIPTSVN